MPSLSRMYMYELYMFPPRQPLFPMGTEKGENSS